MMLFLRSIPVIVALIIFVGFSYATRSVQFFWYIIGATLLAVIVGLWIILRRAMKWQERVLTLAFPALTILMGAGVLLFTEEPRFHYLLAVALAAVIWIFFEQSFYFVFQPKRYQPNSLVNLSSLLCIISAFFASITIFDLQLFANYPLWLAVVTYCVYIIISSSILFHVLDAPKNSRWIWGTVAGLTLTTCFSVLAWLPALPVVKAAVLILPFAYAVVKIREDIAGTPLPSRWTFIVAGLVLLLLLVTTRWFV